MAKLVQEENNYAFRLDQVAWISLKEGNPAAVSADEQKPRIQITLKGNHANNIISFKNFEEAKKYYNYIVTEMSKL